MLSRLLSTEQMNFDPSPNNLVQFLVFFFDFFVVGHSIT